MKLDVNKNYKIKLNGHFLLFNLNRFYGGNGEAISLFTEVITRLNVKPEEDIHLGEKPKYSDPIFIIVNALIHENLYLDSLLRLGHDSNDIRDKYIANIKEISNLDKFKRKYDILALDRADIYGFQNKSYLHATSDILNINIPLININREKSIPNRNIFTLGLYEIPDTILDDEIVNHCQAKEYSDDVAVYPVSGFFNKTKLIDILDLAIIYTLQKSLQTVDTYYTNNKIVDVYFYNNRPFTNKSDVTLHINGKNLIIKPHDIKNAKNIISDIEKDLIKLRSDTMRLVCDILESVDPTPIEDDIVYVKNVMYNRIHNIPDIPPLPHNDSGSIITWFSLEIALLKNRALYINLNNIDMYVKALEYLNKIM